MAILVVCPGCKKSFNVDDKLAGKTGPCPNCKAKITIPAKMAEVKIHTPDEFAGGGKGITGKLLLKPIARQKTRIKPVMAAAIGGAVAAAIAWPWRCASFAPEPGEPLLLFSVERSGLLLVSPALAVAAYTFLRDDELEPYRGMQLFIRAAVCAVVYMILWAGVRLCEVLAEKRYRVADMGPGRSAVFHRGRHGRQVFARSGNGQRVFSLCVLCRRDHAARSDGRPGMAVAVTYSSRSASSSRWAE